MYERFTDRARKVMQLANQEAQRFNHEYIGTEHILLGLIKEGSGVAANVLKNLDVDLRKIRLEVEKLVQSGPDMVTMGKLPQTPRAKKVIEYSMEEARNLNHNYVGTEHILLGLLREQEGVAAQVLMNLGLKLEEVREEVLNLLGHGMEGPEGAERAGSLGGATGRRRSAAGRQVENPRPGQLRPRPHRTGPPRQTRPRHRPRKGNRADHANPQPADEEQPRAAGRGGGGQDRHRRGLRPASRRGQRPRAAGRPPHRRAGPGHDGRRHQVPRPVRRADQGGDERSPPRQEHHPLHRRVAHPGGRGGAEGAIDASNVLKPALSRGEIQCIGATTLDEYRKYIERTAPWTAASSWSWSSPRRRRRPWKSSRGSATATSSTTT